MPAIFLVMTTVAPSQAPTPSALQADIFSAQNRAMVPRGMDDHVAIQAALDALPSGGTVLLAPGTFVIGAPLKMATRQTLIGSGWNTILKAKDGLNGNIIELATTATEHVLLADLALDGNKAHNASGNGIYWNQAGSGFRFSFSDPMHMIRNVLIVQCKNDGLKWVGGAPRGCELFAVESYKNDGAGFNIQGSDNKITDCVAGNCGLQGFSIGPSAGFIQMLNCKAFGNGRVLPSAGQGFKTISSFGHFTGCVAQDNAGDGFSIEWNDTVLTGCIADSNGTPALPGYGFHLAGQRTILNGCYGGDSKTGTKQKLVTGTEQKQAYGLHIAKGADHVYATGASRNNLKAGILNESVGTDIDTANFKGW